MLNYMKIVLVVICLWQHSSLKGIGLNFDSSKESVKIEKKEMTYSYIGAKPVLIEHTIFHLLDASAVEEFGDFYSYQNNFEIKVIKSDGKVLKTDSENIIEMDSSVPRKLLFGLRNKKKSYYKLAISGLEIGDKLDVKVYSYGISENRMNVREHLSSNYYIQNCLISFEFSKSHYFRSESYNFEGEFEKSVQDDVVKYTLSVDTIFPRSKERFVFPYLVNPYIKLFYDSKRNSSQIPDLLESFSLPTSSVFKNERIGGLPYKYSPNYAYKHIKKSSRLTLSSRVNALYDYMKFASFYTIKNKVDDLSYIERSRQFSFVMFHVLNRFEENVEVELALLQSRYFKEALNEHNAIWSIRVKLNGKWQYYNCPEILLNNGEDNDHIEGGAAKGYVLNEDGVLELASEFNWPKSNYDDNSRKTIVSASMLNREADGTRILDINLNRKVTGELKNNLVFATAKPHINDFGKLSKSFPDHIKDMMWSIWRLKHKNAEDELGEEYFAKNKILESFEFEELEFREVDVFEDSLSLEFDMKLKRKMFVTDFNDLMVVDLGALIGSQLHFNERIGKLDRDSDFDFTCPRSFAFDINLKLPDGYLLDSELADWNMDISNEYGSFESSIAVVGDSIICKTKKIYKTNHVDRQHADLLYAFTDASNDFFHKKIIFRKANYILEDLEDIGALKDAVENLEEEPVQTSKK